MSVSRETLLPFQADVSRETCDRLRLFEAMLRRWNARINLVSRNDEGHIWQRHITDSLQLIDLLPPGLLPCSPRAEQTTCAPEAVQPGPRAIDMGSGAGFPGLVLAIATGIPFDLIESDRRKAAFLREAVRETGAGAVVHACRIEEIQLPPVACITARALAPLSKLLSLAFPLMKGNAVALFLKGAGVERELADAAGMWSMQIEQHPSRVDRTGVILRVSEVERA